MNKVEMVTKIAEKTSVDKKNVEAVLSAFMDIVTETLTAGDKVSLVGFGAFEVSERAAREGRNPATGESIHIGPSKSPKFKPSKNLKEAVNR